MEIYRSSGSRMVFVLLVGVFLFLMAVPMWTRAAPVPLPTRPIPTDTPTPTLVATATTVPPTLRVIAPPPECSAIVLVARTEQTAEFAGTWRSLWTWLEWQDGDDGWHVVDGWQGVFDSVTDSGGRQEWSVPPALFGRGPFRWGVAAQRGGTALAYSVPFDLPEQTGQILEIAVTLEAVPQPILLPMTGGTLWAGVLMGLALLVGLLGLVKLSLTWHSQNQKRTLTPRRQERNL